ncbi:MAG: Spy/CpxP family protein refolding chaperone [Acidobacteria bacterium]|nr:Spy/CpxP family protein refolding chaperone [Acidobacteriota bacterium]
MKALILTLAALLPLTAALPAQAQEGRGRWDGPRQAGRGERFARALQLTADQQNQIRALRASHRDAIAPLRASARAARAALAQALQDPATAEATLRDLHQKASEAHFQLLLAGRANRVQVRALLTPEQREKASVLRATHRERARGQMRRMRMRCGD